MEINKQVEILSKVLDKMMKSFDNQEDKTDFILDVCNGYREELESEQSYEKPSIPTYQKCYKSGLDCRYNCVGLCRDA